MQKRSVTTTVTLLLFALCYSVKPGSYLIYDKDWKFFIKCSYKAQSAFLTA